MILPAFAARSYPIAFKIPNGFATDADGNRVPAAETTIVLNCRLKKSKLRSAQITQAFPGTDTHQTLYEGWVNQGDPPVLPDALRKQRNLVGVVAIDGISGRIECKPHGVSQGTPLIGERFSARFTPD